MKEYISNNWKKILYFICGLVIIVDVVLILITPNNVISDYYKYGPKYETHVIDIETDSTEIIEKTAEETGTSFDTAKLIVIFIAVLVFALIIDDISQSREKKK